MPQGLAAIQLSESPHDLDWHPDTGASNHIAINIGTLTIVSPYTGHTKVMVRNGKLLPITHVGTTNLGTIAHPISL